MIYHVYTCFLHIHIPEVMQHKSPQLPSCIIVVGFYECFSSQAVQVNWIDEVFCFWQFSGCGLQYIGLKTAGIHIDYRYLESLVNLTSNNLQYLYLSILVFFPIDEILKLKCVVLLWGFVGTLALKMVCFLLTNVKHRKS